MRNPEKFESRPPETNELQEDKQPEEQEHKPTREEARMVNEPETTQLRRDFGKKFDRLFELDDPHLSRLLIVTNREEDPTAVQRFLDDNRERLSIEAQEFLESSINIKRAKEAIHQTEEFDDEAALSEEDEKTEGAETDKRYERYKSGISALVQEKNDPHRERVLKLIGRVHVAEDSFVLQRFLDDNKEKLSPVAIEAIESTIDIIK